MKDTEIHNGLPEKEIRDFFSESFVKIIILIPIKYIKNKFYSLI